MGHLVLRVKMKHYRSFFFSFFGPRDTQLTVSHTQHAKEASSKERGRNERKKTSPHYDRKEYLFVRQITHFRSNSSASDEILAR